MNCNRNNCGCASRGQHIRINQCTTTSMSGGPCCCRPQQCCQCCRRCCCNHDSSCQQIDYGCLRRAERDFERRVARCLGVSPFAADEEYNEDNGRFGRYRSTFGDNEDKQ